MKAIIIIGGDTIILVQGRLHTADITGRLSSSSIPSESDIESMRHKIAALGERLHSTSMYKPSDVELPNGRIESPRWRKGRNTALNRIIQ